MTAALFDLPRLHFAVIDVEGIPWPDYEVCQCGASGSHKRAEVVEVEG